MSRFLGKWNWWLCKLQKNWHRIFYKHRILNYHIFITLTCLLLKPYFIQTKLAFFSLDLQVKVGENVFFASIFKRFCTMQVQLSSPASSPAQLQPTFLQRVSIHRWASQPDGNFCFSCLSELNYYWEKICNIELRSSILNWHQEKNFKKIKIVWNLGKILLPKNSKILKATNYFPKVVAMSITTKDKICRFDFKSPLAGRSLQNFLPRPYLELKPYI